VRTAATYVDPVMPTMFSNGSALRAASWRYLYSRAVIPGVHSLQHVERPRRPRISPRMMRSGACERVAQQARIVISPVPSRVLRAGLGRPTLGCWQFVVLRPSSNRQTFARKSISRERAFSNVACRNRCRPKFRIFQPAAAVILINARQLRPEMLPPVPWYRCDWSSREFAMEMLALDRERRVMILTLSRRAGGIDQRLRLIEHLNPAAYPRDDCGSTFSTLVGRRGTRRPVISILPRRST